MNDQQIIDKTNKIIREVDDTIFAMDNIPELIECIEKDFMKVISAEGKIISDYTKRVTDYTTLLIIVTKLFSEWNQEYHCFKMAVIAFSRQNLKLYDSNDQLILTSRNYILSKLKHFQIKKNH